MNPPFPRQTRLNYERQLLALLNISYGKNRILMLTIMQFLLYFILVNFPHNDAICLTFPLLSFKISIAQTF